MLGDVGLARSNRGRAFKDLLAVRWMKDRLLRYEVAEDVGGEGSNRA